MSKKSIILLVVTALTLSLALAVSMSFASDPGPAEITLNADGKKPAKFPHKEHQDRLKDCGACHHKDADGKQTPIAEGDKVVKCDSCHNADFANEKLRKWKDVGHGLCKACHTKEKAAGAPTKCGACHPKKS